MGGGDFGEGESTEGGNFSWWGRGMSKFLVSRGGTPPPVKKTLRGGGPDFSNVESMLGVAQ